MRSTRGVALVELLAVMAVPAAIALGSSMDTTGASVSRSSDNSSAPAWLTAAMADLDGCGMDIGLDSKQPLIVYASASTFSFEAECFADESNERLASYGPDTPGETSAAPDTITFSFQPDPTTARPDDFVMMRHINGRRPEAIARNVLPYPGQPFFQYYYRGAQENVHSSRGTALVPNGWLPMRHPAAKHGSVADSGAAARIDAFVALELNYYVTNGRTGRAQRTEHVRNVVAFASLNGTKKRLCEEDLLLRQASFTQNDRDNSMTAAYLTSSGFTTTAPRNRVCMK